MARKWILALSLFFGILALAQVPTKYFIGKSEVSEAMFRNVPANLITGTESYDYDSLRIRKLNITYTHYLDSVSTPGEFIIRKRTPEQIAELSQLFNESYENRKIIKLNIGDTVPNISLVKNIGGDTIPNILCPDKCYLLNFWATWCGNCLKELQPEYIPAITDKFVNEKDFQFLPICIDTTKEDLRQFFESEAGKRYDWLKYLTYLDIDRQANNIFADSGIMPLNVVIGRDGKIKFIKTGRLKDSELSTLEEAIRYGLK